MRCAVGAGSTVSEEGDSNFGPGVIVPLKSGSSCLGDGCLVQIREVRMQQKYPGHQGTAL